jgi:Fuc2NAc and GlcNAc transferase
MAVVFFAIPLFLFAVLLTSMVRKLAMQTQMLAIPSHRSSHSLPTPVGGGVAIVLTYVVMLAIVSLAYEPGFAAISALAAGLPVALAGLVDDRAQLSARIRLAIQFSCALFAIWLAGSIPPLQIGFYHAGGFLFVWVFLPVALVWMTNLYNFMDGIDGLAGMEAAFVGLAAAAMLFGNGDIPLALLCLGLFSGATGFLVWNWPPAKIFMGDVGSGFIGLTLAIIALLSHVHGSMSLWSWLLLLACFIVDASVTLLRRAIAGKPVYVAHRHHAYQHASRQSGGHQKVTVTVLTINVFWLFPLAWLASAHPEHGVYFAGIGIVPLLVMMHRLGAGKECL